MPRKPLDGREHGGRLNLSGGTHATEKSAPLGAPFGLFAKRPHIFLTAKLCSPSIGQGCLCRAPLSRKAPSPRLRGGARAPQRGA
jgi:hypothetical protein